MQTIFSKPVTLRFLKLKKLSEQLADPKGENLKIKAQNYNKLLITINQDILDRFVIDSQGTIFKITDFKPGEFIVRV